MAIIKEMGNLCRLICGLNGCVRNRKVTGVLVFGIFVTLFYLPHTHLHKSLYDKYYLYTTHRQPNASIALPAVELIIDESDDPVDGESKPERDFLEKHMGNQAAATMPTESPPIELPEVDDRLSFEINDAEINLEASDQVALELLGRDHTISGRRLRDRQKLLENGCGGMTPLDMTLTWQPTRYFVVDYDHRLLACIPPLTNEIAWHKYIYRLRKSLLNPDLETNAIASPNSQEENKLVLDTLPIDKANKLLTDEQAVRFLVVQHPFTRLLQLWKLLFDKSNPVGKELLDDYPYMKDFMHHNAVNTTQRIDFRDFVEYVTREAGARSAPEFRPITTLCEPCTNPFELVIKHEGSRDDIEHLLRLGRHVPAQLQALPELIEPTDLKKEQNDVKKYYGMLDRTTLLKLKQLYFWDFKLYGYTFDLNTCELGGLD